MPAWWMANRDQRRSGSATEACSRRCTNVRLLSVAVIERPNLLLIVAVCSGPALNDSCCGCGRPAITPTVTVMERIIGGLEARPHSWPWQCSIRHKYSRSQWCGASVLTSRHVLTAAHCLLVHMLFSLTVSLISGAR